VVRIFPEHWAYKLPEVLSYFSGHRQAHCIYSIFAGFFGFYISDQKKLQIGGKVMNYIDKQF